MKPIILDIDNSSSIQSFVSKVTSDWFDIDKMYYDLKTDSKTDWTKFWHFKDSMFNIISDYLECSPEEFLNIWEEKCTACSATFKGYHCTCHSDKEVFLKNGILPLSEEIVKISDNQERPEAEEAWSYRSKRGLGPYFFLSYKSARNPDNHFFEGPEILLAVAGHQPTSDPEKAIPLIIDCEIPFSILPNKNYYTFFILRAYFNFLDPEDNAEDSFEGYMDLSGVALDRQHILWIEEI